jgi:hypothetical protein
MQAYNTMQVVDKTLWVLKTTGDLMLISCKLLAQPRDGRTKKLKNQRIQLRSAIANKITLALRWHCFAKQLAQKGNLQTALKNGVTRLWLGNDWLSQVSGDGLEQACEEAMTSLLGQATELGLHRPWSRFQSSLFAQCSTVWMRHAGHCLTTC